MNARSAQWLAATLGFVLIVLIGALIFVLVSRPSQGPTASATPTLVAGASSSPSPSLSPLPTFSLFPSLSPLPSPSETPLVTASPAASPTTGATATPLVPTSPAREIRFTGLGLDAPTVSGIERYLLFATDGPSLIRVEVSNATSRSRVCIWEINHEEDRDCQAMRNGVLEHPTNDTGSLVWTMTVIGANSSSSPTVDLTLDFNGAVGAVDFVNFQFQGLPQPAYNGLTAAVDVAVGQLNLTGQFDTGQQHMYRVQIQEAGVGSVKDETGGPATSFTVTQDVAAETSYLISITNPNTAAEPGPVFLRGSITWP